MVATRSGEKASGNKGKGKENKEPTHEPIPEIKVPWKFGIRILFCGDYPGKGLSQDEWRQRLGWFGEGDMKSRYIKYETMGDSTRENDDDVTRHQRFIWVWEIGIWEEKRSYYRSCRKGIWKERKVKSLDGLFRTGRKESAMVNSQPAGSGQAGTGQDQSAAGGLADLNAPGAAPGGRANAKDSDGFTIPGLPASASRRPNGARKAGAGRKKKVDEPPEPTTQEEPTTGNKTKQGRRSTVNKKAKAAKTAEPAAHGETATAKKRGGGAKAGTGRNKKKTDEPAEPAPQRETANTGGRKAAGHATNGKANESAEPITQGGTATAINSDQGDRKAAGRAKKRKADELNEPAVTEAPAPKRRSTRAKKGDGKQRETV